MNKNHKDPQELDLTKPRLASYKQKKWKRHQDAVYWVNIRLGQRKGLKFNQTRCNAIILYDTLPAYCISKVVVMESGEITYENNWMKELDSEDAGSSKDTQRIQCTLYPELRDGHRAQSWCTTWQKRRTERVPYSLECVEEMLQES